MGNRIIEICSYAYLSSLSFSAAISTTGAIMGAVGSKVLSLFAETANVLIKVIKNTNVSPGIYQGDCPLLIMNLHQHPMLLRLEAINAFTLLLKGAGKGATEAILKDLTKQLKNGLADRALAMRIASAQCTQAIIQHARQTLTVHDVESYLQIFFKAFEHSTFPVRRAVSSLCATLLAFTQSNATTDPNKPSVKFAITGEENASKIGEMSSTTLMSIDEMLNQLSACYNRPNVSRETKIGIIETYATLFILLGTEFVETNYATIARHILRELLDTSKQNLSSSDGAFARAQVFFLMNNTIAKRLLSEQGQGTAIRLLVTEFVKGWPPLLPNQPPPNKHTLICVTNLISALICELGSGANVVQVPVFSIAFHKFICPNFISIQGYHC